MNNISYRPLIEDMVWSYSRIETFDTCPYAFFLRYISRCKSEPKFFATYGLLMHDILEKYYRGSLRRDDMLMEYLIRLPEIANEAKPKQETVKKYLSGAIEYLRNFEPFPHKTIAVEEQVGFFVDDIEFTGRLDYIGEYHGKMYLIDHKSGDIKPRSNRKKPTLKDKDLDKRLRQLYLYCAPIKEKYGKLPDALCFNCFRTGTFIEEQFDENAYREALDWLKTRIHIIENADDFFARHDFFYCRYICGLNNDCIYDQIASGR